MAKKRKRPVAGASCSRSHRLERGADGGWLCFDACNKPAPLDRCIGFATPDGSERVHLKLKRSCLADGQKEHLERRVKGGGTAYDLKED